MALLPQGTRGHAEHWSVWLAAALGLAVLGLLAAWLIWPVGPQAPVLAGAPAPSAAATQTPAPVAPAPKPAVTDPGRTAAASGRWSRLPDPIQAVLEPLREDWTELTADQRIKWYDLARRFSSLTPDERERIQARMADWARMTPAERGVARLNFQEIRQLSQKDLLERWEAYQGLEIEERRQWAERAQTTTFGSASPRRAEAGAPVPKSTGALSEAITASSGPARPVGATVVQAPLGATTVLVSRVPGSGVAASSGPKIAATSDFVDPATLLPQPARPSTEPGTSEASTASTGASAGGSSPGSSAAGAPGPGALPTGSSPTGAPSAGGPSAGEAGPASANGEPPTRPNP